VNVKHEQKKGSNVYDPIMGALQGEHLGWFGKEDWKSTGKKGPLSKGGNAKSEGQRKVKASVLGS